MAKDILLYGQINSQSVYAFMESIKEARSENPNEFLRIRINSEGGSPEYGMSIMTKLQELDNFEVLIEGMAHSMAFFALASVKGKAKVSAISSAQFLFHRASYPSEIEGMPSYKGSILDQSLQMTNQALDSTIRTAMNVQAFEALPKVGQAKLADFFAMDSRKEVILTAAEMKEIGLIDDIIHITKQKAAEIEAIKEKLSAGFSSSQAYLKAATSATTKIDDNKTDNTIMNLDELKSKHPELFTQAKAEGFKDGATAERERVEAIMVFSDVDPVVCKAAVESGKPLSDKQRNELLLKSVTSGKLAGLGQTAPTVVTTTEAGQGGAVDEKAKKLAEFEKGVDKFLTVKA